MKNGYYIDPIGHVLGYWELPEKPQDTEEILWVESPERPPLYVSEEKSKKAEIADLQNLLSSTDYKIIRQLEQSTLSAQEYQTLLSQRQAARDRINILQQEV